MQHDLSIFKAQMQVIFIISKTNLAQLLFKCFLETINTFLKIVKTFNTIKKNVRCFKIIFKKGPWFLFGGPLKKYCILNMGWIFMLSILNFIVNNLIESMMNSTQILFVENALCLKKMMQNRILLEKLATILNKKWMMWKFCHIWRHRQEVCNEIWQRKKKDLPIRPMGWLSSDTDFQSSVFVQPFVAWVKVKCVIWKRINYLKATIKQRYC